MPDQRSEERARLIFAVIALCLLVAELAYLMALVPAFNLKAQTSDPEASVVQIAIIAHQTGHLYPNLQSPPFTPAPHGPLLYVSLLGLSFFGLHSFDSLLIAGRIVMFCSYLLAAYLIFALGQRLGLSRLAALVGALVFLTEPDLRLMNVSVRADMIGLLFTLAALTIALWDDDFPSRRKLVLCGLMAAVAICFKQSYLAVPFALAITLLMRRRIREMFWFLGSLGLTGMMFLAALVAHGEPVLRHLFLMRYFTADVWTETGLLLTDFVFNPAQFLWLILSLFGAAWFLREGRSWREQALAYYWVFGWLMALYTLRQVGGALNYLIEPWAAAAVLVPFGLERVVRQWGRTKKGMAVILALMALPLLSLAWNAHKTYLPPADGAIVSAIQGHAVLSTDPYISAHSSSPELLDTYTTTMLESRGEWSSVPLQTEIANQKFDYILLKVKSDELMEYRGHPYLSEPVVRQIDLAYRPLCIIDRRLVLLVPQDREMGDNRAFQNMGCSLIDEESWTRLMSSSKLH